MDRRRLACPSLVLLLLAGAPARGQAPGDFLDRPLAQWVADLADGQPRVRRGAAFVLGKVGSPQAQAPLLEALKDPDASVREASAFALGEIGPRPATGASVVVPALVGALRDSDARVRRSAAYALGKYGPRAGGAGRQLQEALRDPAPMVRQNAAWALGQLDEDGRKAAVTGLTRLLGTDPDALVRRDAAAALGKIGRDAHAALPLLLARFRSDDDAGVRKTALDAVAGVVTSEDTDAVDALRPALQDADADVVRAAAFALANVGGPGSADAVPVLGRTLREGDVPTRRLAATALANVARHAEAALPKLTAALADPDAEVRRSAALGLGNMGAKARPALPALLQALDPAEDEDVRKFAAEALSNVDPNDPDVVAALLRVLGEPGNYGVRHRVVWAVERLKEFEQPGVVRALAETLLESGPEARLLRYEAAKVLALKLGPRVPDRVLDVLLEALGDEHIKIYLGTGAKVSGAGTEARTGQAQLKEAGVGDWRRVVAIAFAKIGTRARQRPEVLPGLRKLAEDSFDPETRKVARLALRQLEGE